MKIIKFLIIVIISLIVLTISISANSSIYFTNEEKALINASQKGIPVRVGIIPRMFPMSECPPESKEYVGINIEMLKLITQKTGLTFEFYRLPIETKTPYQSLQDGESDVVIGTMITENFMNDDTIILSDRLFDASSVFVGKRGVNIESQDNDVTLAILNGFQAGIEYASERFPKFKIITYTNNTDCLKAVLNGKADMALLNKYVCSYNLQKPVYESLQVINIYSATFESCIMGMAKYNRVVISVINKGIASISEKEYTSILMNFTVANPYDLTMSDILYKYRMWVISCSLLIAGMLYLILKLLGMQKIRKSLASDVLTGALTQTGFEFRTKKLLNSEKKTAFITDFDINNFDGYNEVYGREAGDKLLKTIVDITKSYLKPDELICRVYADHFNVLSFCENLEIQQNRIKMATQKFKESVSGLIIINYGIFQVMDKTMPVSKMISCAAAAKRTVKGSVEKYIAVYDDRLHKKTLENAEILNAFEKAVENVEFKAYYQPKYDAKTEQIAGAEALVRWIKPDGTIIQPGRFIELFEHNGQIIRLDFCMLEQACSLQYRLIECGITPVPVSVNFSRAHLYDSDFAVNIIAVVDKYNLPHGLIEIECTETMITEDLKIVRPIFEKLHNSGFILSMDDFGSGYSSLNTLKEIPLDIIKLDRGFLLYDNDDDENKAREIVISIISLAKKLSLKTVAEGVETHEQLEFLRETGCDTIQGFYFSKPIDESKYIELVKKSISIKSLSIIGKY